MKQNIKLIIFFLVFFSSVSGQDTLFLSIEQAMKLSIQNNPDLARVELGKDLLEQQIQGAKSAGLPQISAKGGITDNFTLAQQLLPGEIFGQEGQIAVAFGTRYGLNAGLEANQLIYSRAYSTNLKKLDATRATVALQTLATIEDLVYNVGQLYIQYQTAAEQNKILETNIEKVEHLISIAKAQFENGIIKKLDVDQIRVNRTNLLSQKTSVKVNLQQLLNTLKFYLAVEDHVEIKLTESLDNQQRYPLSSELLIDENINYKILNQQIILNQLDDEVIKGNFYPTVSAFIQYNYSGQANELNFKSDNYSGFFAGLWGVNVSMPLFDGFKNKRGLEENKIRAKQLQLEKNQLKNAMTMNFRNAQNAITQNESLIQTQVENMELADEVYKITQLSYQEGVAPLTDLLNAETGLREAQTQYITANINFKLAELEHIRTSGQLAQLIRLNQN